VSIPERIGKYEVLEAIGKGGFATVYRARDPLMRRIVAIKLCVEPDEDQRRRFLREAQIAGSLDHPNIVRGFDCGFDPAGAYLVEEYLDGEDLRHKIQSRRPIAQRTRVAILIEVARAMEYAHSKGIFHRDLKPGNIRVLASGLVKIMDFGVAKTSSATSPLTKAGTLLGTAGYIAPEQVLGEPFDHRVDIFAFGALAYELLTYTRPFTGQTVSERLKSVLDTTPPPISTSWSECPDTLDQTIDRCLAKDPAARYQSFADVIADLLRSDQDLKRAEEESTATLARVPPPAESQPSVAPPSVVEPSPDPGFERTMIAPAVVPPPPVAAPKSAQAVPSGATPPASPGGAQESGGGVDRTVIASAVDLAGRSADATVVAPTVAPAKVAARRATDASRDASAAPAGDAASAASSAARAASTPAAVATPSPKQEKIAPPVAPPALARPPATPRARGRRWLWVAAAAAFVLAVASLAIWGFLARGRSTPPPVAAAPAPAPVAAAPAPVAAAAPASGRLVIAASPWGELVKVVGADGKPVATPPGASTPLALTLPPGDYVVDVKRPGAKEEARSCRATVVADSVEHCRLDLARVTGLDYFKESGWWR
jgi:serine/threonine-protein kinase